MLQQTLPVVCVRDISISDDKVCVGDTLYWWLFRDTRFLKELSCC